MSKRQFERIKALLYGVCRIDLRQGREKLVEARLRKRLRRLGCDDFAAYLRYVETEPSGAELDAMVDALTTNKTSFFREMQHFDYVRRWVLPACAQRGEARFWCAGCSTGEEPFSLAILLCEQRRNMDRLQARILATDISARVLEKARLALYDQDQLQEVPRRLVQRYFTQVDPQPTCQLGEEPRSMVRFARLNLMGGWPMRGPFEAIFCRNVMIYFDAATCARLVRRFAALLRPGGHLFIGHSETLGAQTHGLRYVQPAIYVK